MQKWSRTLVLSLVLSALGGSIRADAATPTASFAFGKPAYLVYRTINGSCPGSTGCGPAAVCTSVECVPNPLCIPDAAADHAPYVCSVWTVIEVPARLTRSRRPVAGATVFWESSSYGPTCWSDLRLRGCHSNAALYALFVGHTDRDGRLGLAGFMIFRAGIPLPQAIGGSCIAVPFRIEVLEVIVGGRDIDFRSPALSVQPVLCG